MSPKLTSERYDRQVSIHLKVLLKELLPEVGEALKILEAIPQCSPQSLEHRAACLRVINASFAVENKLSQFAVHIEQLSQRALPLQPIVLNKYAPVWTFDPFLPQIPADNVLSLFLVMCWEVMKVYEFIGFTLSIWEERLVHTRRVLGVVFGEVYRDGWIFTDTEGSYEYRAKKGSSRIKDYGQEGQKKGVLRELDSEDEFPIDSIIASVINSLIKSEEAEYKRQKKIMM
ncbi:hypothetical protein B9Z19DRAFT_1131973 [Tuber borchii]|uniref:Uncharacterized protein n=1 Tax=Tuber borchii TaxID=42251 RepID=A0A2T6ZHX0_TUBBO|nr:hypothetical protein B9Z19DRAFT_1131973 [Tuber borchii]